MPTRRSILSTTPGFAGITALSGCSSVFGGTTERHYVDVLNDSRNRHSFKVTVYNESEEVIFEQEYDLEGGKGTENSIIEGAPSRVTVVIDGNVTKEIPWAPREDSEFMAAHPDGCSEATSTSLTIRYAENYFHATYYCATVRG